MQKEGGKVKLLEREIKRVWENEKEREREKERKREREKSLGYKDTSLVSLEA